MMWKRKKKQLQGNQGFNTERVFLTATQPLNNVWSFLETSRNGLNRKQVHQRQDEKGKNIVEHEQKKKPFKMFFGAFLNPFVGILAVLMIISLVLDVILAEPQERDWTTILIIGTMILVSVILRFWQEWKANVSSEALRKMAMAAN